MTDAERPDLDLLADLDAGLLDPQRAHEVRTAALADPRSAAALAALAATRAELAALPDPPVPDGYAERWTAALAAESAEAPTGVDDPRSTIPRSTTPDRADRAPPAGAPAGHRARSSPSTRAQLAVAGRPSWWRPRPALVAAALLGVLVTVGVLWPRPDPLPVVEPVGLATAGRAALGGTDVGDLGDPDRRSGCLRAVAAPGVAPDAPLLGGRRVELAGRPGVLLVLAAGRPGAFRIVVVDPDCGPERGELLGSSAVEP